MGCENSISIGGHLPLGFPASLDLSGDRSRCLSGPGRPPDGCISCRLLVYGIWVEIEKKSQLSHQQTADVPWSRLSLYWG